MKTSLPLLLACAMFASSEPGPNGTRKLSRAGAPPAWAYPVNPPADASRPAPDSNATRRVPGSDVVLRFADVKNLFYTPDWHPEAHPPMPEIVARGRTPEVFACGFCHRAEGTGGPENSALAGLPAGYIIRQTQEFKSGARASSLPEREPVRLMVRSAHAITDDELAAAAAYFAALRPRANIRVIESDSAPATVVNGWRLAIRAERGAQALNGRIIEVPEDEERHVSRDPRVGYLAYVPKGSVARGKFLAETGGKGRTMACAACHGPGLRGLGDVPGIAGRSPSYVMRQLYDFQAGTRNGAQAMLMQPVVTRLTYSDMVALTAYLATLKP